MTELNQISLLDLRFLAWIDKKNNEPFYNRCYISHHPRAYWDSTDVYTLSIHCKENYHGDYHLQLSKSHDDWFCFLCNGKWSETFIHLRHIKYFEELEEICWALTRCKLFKNEYALKEYMKENYPKL